MVKWKMELRENGINFAHKKIIKRSDDFIVKSSENELIDEAPEESRDESKLCKLYTDNYSFNERSCVGLVLIPPEGEPLKCAIIF